MDREEQNKKDWIDEMVKELDTEEKLREDLEVYYGLIQVNGKVIEMLSNGLLSKPNYIFEVFKEFLGKYTDKEMKKCKKEDLQFLEQVMIGLVRIKQKNVNLNWARDIITIRINELKEDVNVLLNEGGKNGKD